MADPRKGLLARFAPGYAAQRAEARNRLIAATLRGEMLKVQAYDAASRGGSQSNWYRPFTSADTEIQMALPFVRAAGADLVRNNPFAAKAVRILVAKIVGTGVRPSPVVNADDDDDRKWIKGVARDEWERFVENCDPGGTMDFYGQQRLAMRACIEGGEAYRLWIPIQDNGRLFWRTRILEGAYLDHQNNEVRSDGSRIVQGVEFDPLGRRVAYHFFKEHPGDRYRTSLVGYDTQRVAAQFVDPIYEVLRPGQTRGISWFAPSATTLKDVHDLGEAEVVRKKMEACIAMVVQNPNEFDDAGGTLGQQRSAGEGGAPLQNASGDPIDNMVPGMIVEAREGWAVNFTAPPASAGLTEHMRERLHAIAAGIGVTYTQMTGDMSQANYSSMRAGEIDFHCMLDVWQAEQQVFQTGMPAWRRVMEAGRLNGMRALETRPKAKWTPPARPWVDPKKDAEGALMQVDAHVLSPVELIERTGRTAEEVLGEIEEFNEMLEGYGLEVRKVQRGEDDGNRDEDTEE